jgi:CDGSH-type Zn-finger protein
MARLVKHTAHGPARIKPQGEQISICRCGLTDDPNGLCVGNHKKTLDEEEQGLYCYDEQLNRREVKDIDQEDCCGGDCGCC